MQVPKRDTELGFRKDQWSLLADYNNGIPLVTRYGQVRYQGHKNCVQSDSGHGVTVAGRASEFHLTFARGTLL